MAELHIALFHDLPSGGAKRTVHAQTRELTRRGHVVDAFVTSTADERFLPLRDVAGSLSTFELPPPPDRERLLAGRPRPADLLQWGRLFLGLDRTARAVARAVDSGDYDVALVHPSQFTQAPHVLRHLRTPALYYCQEVLRAAYEPLIAAPPVRIAIRATLGRVDRRNARAAPAIAVNSAYTRSRVAEVYGRDAAVVYLGVDPSAFRPADTPRDDYLLTVGALHPLKGLDLLIDAVGHLPAAGRPPLVIVADRARERDRDRIAALAARRDVELEIRQRITESELGGLYAHARAVLFAPHREPLGLVPLEAMACGTAVVAVAEGGILETVEDGVTGLLAPRDGAAFARRLEWLLANPGEADRMGRRGRQRVEERWTWEVSVDRLLEVMEELRGTGR